MANPMFETFALSLSLKPTCFCATCRLPMPRSEAADQIYNHTDTFRAAGADRHHGQAARCRYTGGYGTSARFQTQAGGAGEGHQSYIRRCQTAGAGMQNIRDWPAKKSQVCAPKPLAYPHVQAS